MRCPYNGPNEMVCKGSQEQTIPEILDLLLIQFDNEADAVDARTVMVIPEDKASPDISIICKCLSPWLYIFIPNAVHLTLVSMANPIRYCFTFVLEM
jgi:hypothetical protein